MPVLNIKRVIVKQAAFFLFLISFLHHVSQNTITLRLRRVDSTMYSFSKSRAVGFDSLISFVNATFPSNMEKVRAFYTWIAVSISYDKALLDVYKLKTPADLQGFSSLSTQHPDTVLKYRKAVCEGFCLLMNQCCERCAIPSKMVIGVTRLEGVVTDDILHAWNVVKPDSIWSLLDLTWSNGYVDPENHYVKKFSDNFFFTPPSGFIQNHWPLDAMWQLSYYPLTKNSFYKNTVNDQPVFFNYKDSITSYMRLKTDTVEYVTFLHYHAADPENDTYQQQCDRIIHDKMVVYLNLAASSFGEYQHYAQMYDGKPLNIHVLNQCLLLLKKPENYLTLALDYSKNKTFFHTEVRQNFDKMIAESKGNLRKLRGTLTNYRKLVKTMQPNKK